MIVYRIENQHGVGPYRGFDGVQDREWQTEQVVDDRCPSPWTDFGDLWQNTPATTRHTHFFGFLKLSQLKMWFQDAERERLRALGYRIVRLDVPRVVFYSLKQCAFRRHQMKYLRTRAK